MAHASDTYTVLSPALLPAGTTTPYVLGSLPTPAQFTHIPLRSQEGLPALPPLALPPPARAATTGAPMGEPSQSLPAQRTGNSTTALMVCNTDEPLLARLVQTLKDFFFVELHWCLPAALLPPSLRMDDQPLLQSYAS